VGTEPEPPHKKWEDKLAELMRAMEFRHPDGPRFLATIKAGDLETVKRMVQSNRDLLFVADDYYGSPVRAAADTHPEIGDYLARLEAQRLREGSVPEVWLYGAIHDLGEAAHAGSQYPGSEALRTDSEPVVAGFLTHNDPQIRRIAVSVLSVHWDMKQYVQTFRVIGLNDPDESVRQYAVHSVGWLLRGSRDRDASRFLLGIFKDPIQPAWIRKTAYHGLEEIWQGFDVGHAKFVRKLRPKDAARAEAEKRDTAAETMRLGSGRGIAWEEFVDWEFIGRVEQATGKDG